MLIAILSGIVFALLLIPLSKYLRGNSWLLASLIPIGLLAYFLQFVTEVRVNGSITKIYEWVPALGLNLSFHLDGLSLLFALLITGIGSLVFIYTAYYLKGHVHLGKFFGYLSIFMSAMLGLVLSDNLMSLFMFWELTSISSFFLIGFNNNDPASRKSALTALIITGFGGLLLLVGALFIANIGGTYSIQELLNSGVVLQEHPSYVIIMCLIFGAAFTKSAQFPFHFWLPGAMKAPTPVSTYLHSATMVKAGIYLLVRFTPVLGNHIYWHNTLMVVGGFTMIYTAFQIFFKTDLKGILAYSTISALGIMVFLIGLGTQDALVAALVFICVHALYKATLFLVTGIIDHETGTRDVTKLSGLGKILLPVGIAGFLAALSNGGVPPTFGFVGKDLIYEATLHHPITPYFLTGLSILTKILLLYAGFLVGIKPFFGKQQEAFSKIHLPSPLLWAPPLFLAILCLVFGFFPQIIGDNILNPALLSLRLEEIIHLKLWHGFNTIFALSLLTIGVGIALYFILKPKEKNEARGLSFERFGPQAIAEKLATGSQFMALKTTNFLQNGYLRYYVTTILVFLCGLLAYRLFTGLKLYIDFSKITEVTFMEVSMAAVMFVAIGFTVFSPSRLAAIVSMGVVGYTICMFFVFYSAPDLAMTQFTIDTLTVILFVLVLYRLPKYIENSSLTSKIRDSILSLFAGGLITLIALEVLNEPKNRETTIYYAENAYKLAKGKNIVNVILVDFRGFDTMVEITVLTIAAIGVFALLKLRLKVTQRH